MTQPRYDFSFDKRVADRYDFQRAHPADVSQAIGAAIVAIAGHGARVLELGVGTGRIAWPVIDAGARVVGIDLAPHMLGEVYSQRRRRPDDGLALARSDMHQLPFADDRFDGVLAVHVLHLARDGQAVLAEIRRVLRPNGVFIQGDDWVDPQSVFGLLRDELRRHAMRLAPMVRPPSALLNTQEALRALGGHAAVETIAAEWTVMLSPAARLAAIAARMDNESWMLPADLFDACLTHLREFAAQQWDDLETEQPVRRRFILKTTRGAW